MDKEKLTDILGFILLGIYAIGFIAVLFYKLAYAPHEAWHTHYAERFANNIIMIQSAILEICLIPLIKDLANGKKWYNQILVYLFAYIVLFGITGGITAYLDLLSGRPWIIL